MQSSISGLQTDRNALQSSIWQLQTDIGYVIPSEVTINFYNWSSNSDIVLAMSSLQYMDYTPEYITNNQSFKTYTGKVIRLQAMLYYGADLGYQPVNVDWSLEIDTTVCSKGSELLLVVNNNFVTNGHIIVTDSTLENRNDPANYL